MDLANGGNIIAIVAIARAVEAVSRLFWNKYNKKKYNQPAYERRRSINPNDKPGKSDICIRRGEALSSMGTKLKTLCESNTREHSEIKENIKDECDDMKRDIRRIFDRLPTRKR